MVRIPPGPLSFASGPCILESAKLVDVVMSLNTVSGQYKCANGRPEDFLTRRSEIQKLLGHPTSGDPRGMGSGRKGFETLFHQCLETRVALTLWVETLKRVSKDGRPIFSNVLYHSLNIASRTRLSAFLRCAFKAELPMLGFPASCWELIFRGTS